MKRHKMMLKSGLTFAVVAALVLMTTGGVSAQAISVANGHSVSKDPRQAGAEAAAKAKEGLGQQEAKLVLVFDSVGQGPKDKEAMLVHTVGNVRGETKLMIDADETLFPKEKLNALQEDLDFVVSSYEAEE